MKAKDLMIGDWVNYQDDDKIVPKQVSEITDFKQLQLHDKENWIIVGEKYCEPIPLTAEILENNGFINYDFEHIAGQHKWSWWRDTGTLVSLWCRELNDDPRDGWMIRIESSDATCCFRVESIHEMQHALRLCGIEKEIIL